MNCKQLSPRFQSAVWAVVLTSSTMLGQVFNHLSPSGVGHNLPTLGTARQPQLLPPAYSCTPAKGAVWHLLLKGGHFEQTLITFSVSMPLEQAEGGTSTSKLSITAQNLCLAICMCKSRNTPRICILATSVAWPQGHLHSFLCAGPLRSKANAAQTFHPAYPLFVAEI